VLSCVDGQVDEDSLDRLVRSIAAAHGVFFLA
jgi:hypothetical protein